MSKDQKMLDKQTRLLELMALESSPGLIHYKAFDAQPADRAGEWRSAGEALMAAAIYGDEPRIRESVQRLEGAPGEELDALAEGLIGFLDSGCSGSLCLWLAKEGWFERAQRRLDGRSPNAAESPALRLAEKMALSGNRDGLDALADRGLISFNKALESSIKCKKASLCVHFANRLRSAGLLPSSETAGMACASLAAVFDRPTVRAGHPMLEHLTLWADRIDQKARSRAWRSAIEFEMPELMATLLRAGLTLEDWRLTEGASRKGDRPSLVEAAIEAGSRGRMGGQMKSLSALILVDEIAQGKDGVRPAFLADLGPDDLRSLKKLGVGLDEKTHDGSVFLHLGLAPGQKRWNGSELKKMGALLGELWHHKNDQGVSPLESLSPSEQSFLLPGLAEHEKKAMKKQSKPESGALKKRARSL